MGSLGGFSVRGPLSFHAVSQEKDSMAAGIYVCYIRAAAKVVGVWERTGVEVGFRIDLNRLTVKGMCWACLWPICLLRVLKGCLVCKGVYSGFRRFHALA